MSKASKKRACPAVGREISSAECGENRISRYACPAECPHLPFGAGNYSQLLELEEKLDHDFMDYSIASAPDRRALERALQAIGHHPNPHAMHAFYVRHLFFERGADGRTCAERWERAREGGFKNDERVLHRAKSKIRVALLEIQQVVDAERIDVVDLLAPEAAKLRVRDRSLAATTARFAVALTWVYPLPHYWRLHGTGMVISAMGTFEPREIVTEIVRHLGGPLTEPEMRVWLAENFVRFDEALMATCRLRRMQTMAGMDAKFGKAIYELQAAFGECQKRLDEAPEVEWDKLSGAERAEGFAEARVWFAEMPEGKEHLPAAGGPVLGRVLLGQAHWRLEAMGGKNLARLRERFEAELGGRARFTGERLDDFGAKLAADEPAVDRALAPPRLLENAQIMRMTASRVPALPPGTTPEQAEAEFFRAADRQFLEDKIPALDGRTPREAAADPALRPRLIRLLKERVRGQDERNLETGRADDINWLLRELGADEILFDPPPRRPVPPHLARDEDDDGRDSGEAGYAGTPGLPEAPPLPAKPLSAEEATRRLETGMAAFETAADAFDSLTACGVTIIDDVDELVGESMDDTEYAFAINFVLQAVLALVPPGHRGPATSYASLEAKYRANLTVLLESVRAKTPEALMKVLRNGSQPALITVLATMILETARIGPKDLRPAEEMQLATVALVQAVVEELDCALR